jgi:2-dehydropantoate 2-reductase
MTLPNEKILTQTEQKSNGSINIIGDGSIGHLLTGYLLHSGQSVSLFSHSNKPSKQVTLTSPDNKFCFSFTTHTQSLTRCNSSNPAIITAKAHQLETICQQLAGLPIKPACILILMNGLGLLEICRHWLPSIPVYQASTTQAAKLEIQSNANQALIKHTGYGETLVGEFSPLGSLCTAQNSKMNNVILALIKTLDRTITPVKWSENHYDNLWVKLLINAIINPLTAVNDVKNGALIKNSALLAKTKQLCKELAPLLAERLPVLTWQALHDKVIAVANATAENSSSMRQDILFSRKTEIEFITGYILNKANEIGCSLPSHRSLYEQVKGLENQTQTSVTK